MPRNIRVEFRGSKSLFYVPDSTFTDEQWQDVWTIIGKLNFWSPFPRWMRRKPKCDSGYVVQQMFARLLVELDSEWQLFQELPADPLDRDHSEWLSLNEDMKANVRKRMPATIAGFVAHGPDVYRAGRHDGAKLFLTALQEVRDGATHDFRDWISDLCN